MKAELKLANGTIVQIDGSLEEVQNLLTSFSGGQVSKKTKQNRRKYNSVKNSKISKKDGPVGLIKELAEEGYFKGQKRSLSDIQKKLEERGHIYAQTSLSPALTRLTRNRTVRRLKETKGWVYVI